MCCKNSDLRTFHAFRLVSLHDTYKVFAANLKCIDVMISWPDYLRMLLCITKVSIGYKYVIFFLLAMNFRVIRQDYKNDDLFKDLIGMTQKECRAETDDSPDDRQWLSEY